MIKLEHVVLASPEQIEFIIEGMRNPLNSWEKSDSYRYWSKTHDKKIEIYEDELKKTNNPDEIHRIKDILYSVCPGFNDHLEEVLKKFREFKPQEHLDQFNKIDFTKQYWECHFPGNYRYISVHKVDN